MTHRMTVLASGSGGNSTLIEAGGFGLLVDCGLPPKELTARLQTIGADWGRVNAVVITHTHSDHWNRYTLEHLRRLEIPLFAHPRHHTSLSVHAAYTPLPRAGLTREYDPLATVTLTDGLTLRAVQVPHDSDPTFAVRIDYTSPTGGGWAVGIASDLGRVPDGLFTLFAGVDVLGIEFNHCEKLERASRRPRFLVDRVLSDYGHLSNRQAAEAVRALAAADSPDGLQAVVQLHLSRDCNTQEMAYAAGLDALAGTGSAATVVTATQSKPAPSVSLNLRPLRVARSVPSLPASSSRKSVQPCLPGLEPDAGSPP